MLTAQRTEKRLLEIDMAEEIPDGATASAPAVVIFDCEDKNPYHDCRVAGCTDATAELTEGAVTLVGDTFVQFTKRAPSDDTEQLREYYRIECTVDLNNGEKVAAGSARQRLPLLRIYR